MTCWILQGTVRQDINPLKSTFLPCNGLHSELNSLASRTLHFSDVRAAKAAFERFLGCRSLQSRPEKCPCKITLITYRCSLLQPSSYQLRTLFSILTELRPHSAPASALGLERLK